MMHILTHGPVDRAQVDALSSLADTNVIVLDADAEEKEWSAPPGYVADIDILFSTHPPRNLAAMRALALFQIGSVGYTQIVGLGLPERGVRACNARGVFDVPIAEWNLAMMINLARDLRGMIRNQEAGKWDAGARYQQEINGRVVGIWGYGGIGRETARLCRAMGLTIYALSRQGLQPRENIFCLPGTGDPAGVLPARVFGPAERDTFLAGLDFLIVAMPLTDVTRGIVGRAELAALPRHAFVLNPARGPIIDEDALLDALRDGDIAGAALDTHYHYPLPPDHPLWRFPNVIMTPHISGSSLNQRYTERIWTIFVENVRRFRTGRPLLNELTAAQLQTP